MLNPRLDLGNLENRILVFGGPYSNLAATESLLREAKKLNIAPQHIICTGDVVAYCAEPEQTCQTIINSGMHVVMGNCEESLAQQSGDCGCGFEPGMVCSTLSEKWYRYATNQISSTSRLWMGTLPSSITFNMGRFNCSVIHGGVQQINRFIFASTDEKIKQQEIHDSKSDIVIAGHCGLPFGQKIGEQGWLNAGVIGLPANDGTNNSWYMLLEPDSFGFSASWHSLPYDFNKTYDSMIAHGLVEYAESIRSGLWPSMDILPTDEQSGRGQKINLSPITFSRSS